MPRRAAVHAALCALNATLAAAAVLVVAAAPCAARPVYDELSVTVDPTSFFEDDAAWLFATRVALGVSSEGDVWPQLGLGVGHVFPSHFFLAATVDGRPTGERHVRAGVRFGALFRRRALNVGFGSSLSVLAIPDTREVGPVATTWLEVSWKLRKGHALTVLAEADVLVEQLGFDRSRAQMAFGLGWTMRF